MPTFYTNNIPYANTIPYANANPYGNLRGPLDFIGNWIQSSEWFPIEVNVPDTFAAVGNGVSSFANNIGSGFQTFTQNAGNAFQNFAQGLSQRPIIGAIVRPIQGQQPQVPPVVAQKYFVVMPTQNVREREKYLQNKIKEQLEMENDILEPFP